MFISDGKRTPLPEDFSDVELDTLASLLNDTPDAELRARLADVLWVRRRDHKAARVAVSSYLQVADELLRSEESWSSNTERAARAVQLAASLGKTGTDYTTAIQHLHDYALARASQISFAVARLMEILLEQRQGDAARMAATAEQQGTLATSDKRWHMAAEYYRLKARWDDRLNHTEDKRASLVAAAESYATWAGECLTQERPSHLEAAEHLQEAIAGLRAAGGEDARIDELRRQLTQVQERAVAELGVFEKETSLGDLPEQARAMVKQDRWQDALLRLAFIAQPLSATAIRERVERLAKRSPLMYLIGKTKIDQDGRPIFRIPSLWTDNAEERALAMFAHMCENASLEREINVVGMIRPARQQVLLDHHIGEAEFLAVVTANPFVAEGHELLYAKGLRAGMVGDFIAASHLLMPALENSLRGVLKSYGMIISGIKDGIQLVFSLNTLLADPKATEILGEDLVFNLRSLFSDPAGDNLRNRALHGLAHQFEYAASPAYEYAWWIVLHLCFHFRVLAERTLPKTVETTAQEPTG